MTDNNTNHLLEVAERKRKILAFWSNLIYQTHMFGNAISQILALIVPFGLALLLYIGEEDKRLLNIALLFASALSLVLQMIDHTMRFAERSRHGARLLASLEVEMARYKDGRLSAEDFEKVVTEISKNAAEEPWA